MHAQQTEVGAMPVQSHEETPPGHVTRQLHRQGALIDDVFELVYRLRDRLEPALGPELPQPGGDSPDEAEMRCDVALRLDAYNDRLEELAWVVGSTTDRVDL